MLTSVVFPLGLRWPFSPLLVSVQTVAMLLHVAAFLRFAVAAQSHLRDLLRQCLHRIAATMEMLQGHVSGKCDMVRFAPLP